MSDSLARSLIKGLKYGDHFSLGDERILSDLPYWVSSGCYPIDAIIGGGIPGGRLIELYGDESTGKSLVALSIMANMQRQGGIVLLLDTEMTTSRDFAQLIGVDIEEAIFAWPTTIQEVHERITDFLEAKSKLDEKLGYTVPALIVWDSIAANTTQEELETVQKQGLDRRQMPSHAIQISRMLRILPRELSKAGVTGVFINQVRTNIGVQFGDKDATMGGKALKFYASVRVKLTSVRPYRPSAGNIEGFELRATIKKNKVSKPLGRCMFPVLFDKGIDNAVACLWYLKDIDVITTRGSWHHLHVDGKEEPVKFQLSGWHEVFEEYEPYIQEKILGNVIREEEDDGDFSED